MFAHNNGQFNPTQEQKLYYFKSGLKLFLILFRCLLHRRTQRFGFPVNLFVCCSCTVRCVQRVKYLQKFSIFPKVWVVRCVTTLVGDWPQAPHQPFHPDNKEPPAAHSGGLLNEISYQSANSCGLCLAIQSGYESPSAALNSYHLDVYLLGSGGLAGFLSDFVQSKFHSVVCGCQGSDSGHQRND